MERLARKKTGLLRQIKVKLRAEKVIKQRIEVILMGSESYCWTNALLLRAATLVTQLLLPIDFSRPLKALHVINKSRNKQSSSSCCSVCTQPQRKRLIFLLSEETARCQSSWNNVRNNFNTLEDCQNQSSSITTNTDVSFPALNVRFDLDCTLISVNLVTRSCVVCQHSGRDRKQKLSLCAWAY